MACGIVGSILGGILTGGAGPALGAGIGAAIPSIAEIAKVIVDRTIPDPKKKAEAQAEIREVMTAINNSTGALNVLSQTQGDRTASMGRLAAKLGELVQHVANLERLNGEHAKGIDRNHTVLNRIAWSLSGKGPSLTEPP